MVLLSVFAGCIPMWHMADLEYWSDDHRFGLNIAEEKVSQLLKMCIRAGTNETGGILVGLFSTIYA